MQKTAKERGVPIGVWPHLHYHDQPWSANGPQTYLQLAIQHANDWGTRTAVVT